MLKILVIADIHGEFEKFSEVMDSLKENDFDLVICPGDFTDMHNIPEGYSQVDISELVLQKILSLGKPVLCIPGNHEPYDILDVFDEYDVNLHGRVRKFKGIEFIGFGGAATPFNTKFEPTEEEIKEALEKKVKNVKGKFILVTHNPPFGTNLDKTETGEHVGSKVIREFIKNNKPLLAISAHIHEAGGTDKLNGTALFYPGVAYEGYYGLLEVGKEIKCEIKKT
ncbi:MAG: metallophosphoesterase [Candidatus Aenigmatarchaeota archaeon]|nr:MAG: metallophosphoesterase [Candidatus Aenigmarchaeota archaeon]